MSIACESADIPPPCLCMWSTRNAQSAVPYTATKCITAHTAGECRNTAAEPALARKAVLTYACLHVKVIRTHTHLDDPHNRHATVRTPAIATWRVFCQDTK